MWRQSLLFVLLVVIAIIVVANLQFASTDLILNPLAQNFPGVRRTLWFLIFGRSIQWLPVVLGGMLIGYAGYRFFHTLSTLKALGYFVGGFLLGWIIGWPYTVFPISVFFVNGFLTIIFPFVAWFVTFTSGGSWYGIGHSIGLVLVSFLVFYWLHKKYGRAQ